MVKQSVKTIYSVATFSSLIILAFSLTSFLSPNWTECTALRNVTGAPDSVNDPPNDPFSGLVRFGVIYGHKEFNYGFGTRDSESFSVYQEYNDEFNKGYIIVSLVFTLSAVIFGGVSLVFFAINVRMVPIETLHGRPGLFLWSGIGLLSGTISVSIYAALHSNELKNEALSDSARDDLFITHRVVLGYSYWFLVVCDVLFLLNLVLVCITMLIDPVDEPLKLPKLLKCLTKEHGTNEQPPVELREGIVY